MILNVVKNFLRTTPHTLRKRSQFNRLSSVSLFTFNTSGTSPSKNTLSYPQHHRRTYILHSGLNGIITPYDSCNHCIHPNKRLFSNNTEDDEFILKESMISKIRRQLGLKQKRYYSSAQLQAAGKKLYSCCVHSCEYQQFFDDFQLPDIFWSWFLVVELHMWFVMIRLARMGDDGVQIRNVLVNTMWEDCDSRLKSLDMSFKPRKNNLIDLYGQFCAAILNYDEGLLGDDKILAASVWRTLFDKQEVDPRFIATVVGYIRKQSNFMLEQDVIMFLVGEPRFFSLHGEAVDRERYEGIVRKIRGLE